jgi:hypothetical protein
MSDSAPDSAPLREDEPDVDTVEPAGGCRRAGCGFLLGVLGSALVTLLVVATLLTRGHPLTFAARLLELRSTPSPTPTPHAAGVTAQMPVATSSATGAPATATASPTFIPVPTAIPTATPSPTPTATPTPIISLRQVNALGRYESMQFVIQTVVDLSRQADTFWERVCGSDQLLLVAGGEVIAGFDLAKVVPGDLRVEGQHVRLVLPPAEVLSYFVKEDQTYVYLRNTGLLCRADRDLETQARREAEQRLLEYALEQGILARAEQAGKGQLEAFLRGLGFAEVELAVRAR